MKYSKAQLAKHLDVTADDVMETAEREGTGEVVVILTDYRKFVIQPEALDGKAEKTAKMPLPPDLK